MRFLEVVVVVCGCVCVCVCKFFCCWNVRYFGCYRAELSQKLITMNNNNNNNTWEEVMEEMFSHMEAMANMMQQQVPPSTVMLDDDGGGWGDDDWVLDDGGENNNNNSSNAHAHPRDRFLRRDHNIGSSTGGGGVGGGVGGAGDLRARQGELGHPFHSLSSSLLLGPLLLFGLGDPTPTPTPQIPLENISHNMPPTSTNTNNSITTPNGQSLWGGAVRGSSMSERRVVTTDKDGLTHTRITRTRTVDGVTSTETIDEVSDSGGSSSMDGMFSGNMNHPHHHNVFGMPSLEDLFGLSQSNTPSRPRVVHPTAIDSHGDILDMRMQPFPPPQPPSSSPPPPPPTYTKENDLVGKFSRALHDTQERAKAALDAVLLSLFKRP